MLKGEDSLLSSTLNTLTPNRNPSIPPSNPLVELDQPVLTSVTLQAVHLLSGHSRQASQLNISSHNQADPAELLSHLCGD